MKPIWKPSPNYSKREQQVKYIILHGTWMNSTEEALNRLCDPKSGVSAHYLIDEDGKLYQMVKDTCIAWHAGLSAWKDDISLNQTSIGIEMSNPGGGAEYTDSQYKTLTLLLKVLLDIHELEGTAVLAHSDIAPDRKNDPGAAFDWQKLYVENVAKPVTEKTAPTYEDLLEAGYVGTEEVVRKACNLR